MLKSLINEFRVIPNTKHSDRGRHFVSQVVKTLCQELEINQKLHCAFRPQASGLVERMHRSLKDSLFVTSHQLDVSWLKVLPEVVSALNSTVHSATKVTPFQCIYGRSGKMDMFDHTKIASSDPSSHGNQLKRELNIIHNAVKICNEAAENAAKMSQKQADQTILEPGDKCLIWREQRGKKGYKWIGPCIVKNVFDFIVEVENNEKVEIVSKHHIRLLPPRPDRLKYDPYEIDDFIVIPENDHKEQSGGGGGEDVNDQNTEPDVPSDPPKIEVKSEPNLSDNEIDNVTDQMSSGNENPNEEFEHKEEAIDSDITQNQAVPPTVHDRVELEDGLSDEKDDVLISNIPVSTEIVEQSGKNESELNNDKPEPENTGTPCIDPTAHQDKPVKEAEPVVFKRPEPIKPETDSNTGTDTDNEAVEKAKKKQRSKSLIDRAKKAQRQRTKSQCEKEEQKAKTQAKATTLKPTRMAPRSRSNSTSSEPSTIRKSERNTNRNIDYKE